MNRDQIADAILGTLRLEHINGEAMINFRSVIEAADAIMALDGWQTIGNRPPVGPVLAFEDGSQYAAEWITEPDGEGYWTASCGQPVVRCPEPTHWKPLDQPPGDAG